MLWENTNWGLDESDTLLRHKIEKDLLELMLAHPRINESDFELSWRENEPNSDNLLIQSLFDEYISSLDSPQNSRRATALCIGYIIKLHSDSRIEYPLLVGKEASDLYILTNSLKEAIYRAAVIRMAKDNDPESIDTLFRILRYSYSNESVYLNRGLETRRSGFILWALHRIRHKRVIDHYIDLLKGHWTEPGPQGPAVNYERVSSLESERQAVEEAGRMTDELFEKSCELSRYSIPFHVMRPKLQNKSAAIKHQERIARVVLQRTQNLSKTNLELLNLIRPYAGIPFLLRACEIIEDDKKIDHIPLGTCAGTDLQQLLCKLANLSTIYEEESPEWICSELNKFSKRTLSIVLFTSGAAQELVGKVLGEKMGLNLAPLLSLLGHLAQDLYGKDHWDDLSCANPLKGTISPTRIRNVINHPSAELRKLLGLYEKIYRVHKSVMVLINAAMGWNSEEHHAKLKKRTQIYVRAHGLRPLKPASNTIPEACKRYIWLKKFADESKQFGQQRRTNEGAAAAAGLENLAMNAGFDSVTRLEWCVEAHLNKKTTTPKSLNINEYSLSPDTSDPLNPKIGVTKNGKALKNIPAKLKKNKSVAVLADWAKVLKGQVKRARQTLENVLISGEYLGLSELESLSSLPSTQALIRKLLLKTEDGEFGFLLPESMELKLLNESKLKVIGPLTLAHPIDLIDAGVLTEWQQYIFKHKIIQPIKQIFRESYVLTPAEREAVTESRRFHGQVLSTHILGGLLKSRSWIAQGEHGVELYKSYPKSGLQLNLRLMEGLHYLTQTPNVPIGALTYTRFPADSSNKLIPLNEIPPIILSEGFRDVDLFASVAQSTDYNWKSQEQCVHRGDLLRELIKNLGLSNVNLKKQWVYIAGKLANYRVHLASAVIHIDPGSYLCIVPAAHKRESFFLPFAGDEDPKLNEVVSKVLLLANDSKIKDRSILEQINFSKQSDST